MRQEIKKQKMQHLADLIAGPSLAQSSPWSLWPESALGGDGPWNNYGDEEEESGPPITVDVPPIATDVTLDVPPHDYISF
jgi:hypothetical protein